MYPVNRNFYLTGILFTALYVLATTFQGWLQYKLGAVVSFRQSFIPWSVLVVALYFTIIVIVIVYYKARKYTSARITAIILLAASVLFCFVTTFVLLMNQLQEAHPITFLLLLLAGLIHFLSLLLSPARERIWLKVFAIAGIAVQLTLLILIILYKGERSFNLTQIFNNIRFWASLAGGLVPVFLILNFLSELKTSNSSPQSFRPLPTIAVIIVFGVTCVLGWNLVNRRTSYSRNEISTQAREIARSFDARVYVNRNSDTLRYRLMIPSNYHPEAKYPLMVVLHHGGAHGTDNIIQVEASEPAPLLSKDAAREKYPAFIFVPQCPPGTSWGGISNSPSIDQLVFEAIDSLEREFSIDKTRRYIAGTSMGGYGTWHFICKRPEMFAAAIPMCGAGDPDLARHIKGVKVWAFHGRYDKNVPVRFTRDMIDAMKSAGEDPKYTEFPEAGHNIWEDVIATPGLIDWLFEQRKFESSKVIKL